MRKDPICGMEVDESSGVRTERNAQIYYFCSEHCRDKFLTGEDSSMVSERRSSLPSSAGYTCPIHPEVESDKPGACPRCGMELEPRTVIAEEETQSPEMRDMKRNPKC